MVAQGCKVVVMGAYGYTGKLVSRYLCEKYPNVSIGLAGRNMDKLKNLQVELQQDYPKMSNIRQIKVDLQSKEQIKDAIADCEVVINMAGPYTKFGANVIESCIDQGCHYCDLAAELPWMRKNILQYHEQAAAKGVKIVHACGTDSIPTDAAVWMAAKALHDRAGAKLGKVEGLFVDGYGGFSGGTAASLLQIIEDERPEKDAALGPYGLNPGDDQQGPDKGEQWGMGYSAEVNKYTYPFLMSFINAKVVRRTNYLLNKGYGPEFAFDEKAVASSALVAAPLSASMIAGGLAVKLAPFRWLIKQIIPQGSGPSKKMRENGFLKYKLVATDAANSGQKVVSWVEFKNADPGYKGTSMLISETALALADGLNEQFGSLPTLNGGVLTPMSACGGALVDKLNLVDSFTFKLLEDECVIRKVVDHEIAPKSIAV